MLVENELFAHAIDRGTWTCARATRPWQARILPARPNPPSPILPLTPTTKRSCQSVHHMYPYSCPSCAPGQHARSSIIEFWGCTCSLVRPVTASHVSLPRIPSLHFLVLTGFQIPSCLFSTIKRPEHRSFWCLFGLVGKTPCTIVHAVPPIRISSISVPQPSQSVPVLMIAQTWSFCEVVCRILLACQHSSSLPSLTKQCFLLKNRYAYARVSIIHPWYGVFAFQELTKRCHGKSQKGQ